MIRVAMAAALLLVSISTPAATSLDQAKAALGKNPPDYDTAIPLLVTGAKRSDPGSLYLLGRLKELGMGVTADQAGAITLYQAAAKHRYFPAQKRLAEMGIGNLANPAHIKALSDGPSAQYMKDRAYVRSQALKALGAQRVTGRALNVLENGVLVDDETYGAVFVYGHTAHVFDGDRVTEMVTPAGAFEYYTALGARKKVRAFDLLSETTIQNTIERLVADAEKLR